MIFSIKKIVRELYFFERKCYNKQYECIIVRRIGAIRFKKTENGMYA